MSEIVSIERPDDEKIEIYVNGVEVASANHDEHGWSGMAAVERTALAVAQAVSADVERLRAEARSSEAYWRSRISHDVYRVADDVGRVSVGGIRVGEAAAQIVRAVAGLVGQMSAADEHRCPSCAPGYDCERGVYTPAPPAPAGEPTGCEREGGEPR